MFTNKESYIQYRAEWKRNYAALSQSIRDLKFCRKSTTTIQALGQTERYERTKKAHKTEWGFFPQSLCLHYRAKATAMLEELKNAKAEAQRQYLANKAQVPAST